MQEHSLIRLCVAVPGKLVCVVMVTVNLTVSAVTEML